MNDTDALVIGGGPAGAASAILLAKAGWRVVLVEQHAYPRQKVCGECIAAGNLELIDELGIGEKFQKLAGAELRQVGWMGARRTIIAKFPACSTGRYQYGRALGRDVFDSLLLEQARSLGVRVMQPAKVRAVMGEVGQFECDIEERFRASGKVTAAIIVDAHGSWEMGPSFNLRHSDNRDVTRVPQHAADLFAFKARFQGATLAPQLLSVFALKGGYGGIVVADGSTTLACCIRRDALRACRAKTDTPAGIAVEALLRDSCLGIREGLRGAERCGSWISVGPLRPGIRLVAQSGVFRVGNSAGETHPLIGEGITMALQSAKLLATILIQEPVAVLDADRALILHRRYAQAWTLNFAPRLQLASAYAHIAMRPSFALPMAAVLRHWPALLTHGARFAGKARVPQFA